MTKTRLSPSSASVRVRCLDLFTSSRISASMSVAMAARRWQNLRIAAAITSLQEKPEELNWGNLRAITTCPKCKCLMSVCCARRNRTVPPNTCPAPNITCAGNFRTLCQVRWDFAHRQSVLFEIIPKVCFQAPPPPPFPCCFQNLANFASFLLSCQATGSSNTRKDCLAFMNNQEGTRQNKTRKSLVIRLYNRWNLLQHAGASPEFLQRSLVEICHEIALARAFLWKRTRTSIAFAHACVCTSHCSESKRNCLSHLGGAALCWLLNWNLLQDCTSFVKSCELPESWSSQCEHGWVVVRSSLTPRGKYWLSCWCVLPSQERCAWVRWSVVIEFSSHFTLCLCGRRTRN